MEDSEIVQFYDGRSVFISGGTGFMGKVLIEKLLRSCPGIHRLYLLMRPSKGKDVACRLQELISNQVFDSVRSQGQEKMVAVEGDLTLPGLGLSNENLKLLTENVSVVFNAAATVRFDEELKKAIEMNALGPRRILEISRQMKQLEAFVHVSTAFCNVDREVVDEVIYPSKIDPVNLVDLIQCLPNDTVNGVTKELLGKFPNTYTFTKNVAEQILDRESIEVPLAIVRPSVVTSALKEPSPGWIDNFNGPMGLLAGVCKGFVRVARGDAELYPESIPVDYSINLMIAVAWKTAKQKPKNTVIYTSTTGEKKSLSWNEFQELGTRWMLEYPCREMLWYPGANYIKNNIWFQINMVIFHLLPAYLLDMICFLIGKRRKLVRLYKKYHKNIQAVDYFTTRQFRFSSRNSEDLYNHMSNKDQTIFCFDVEKIDWNTYIKESTLAMRSILLKEDPNNLEEARRTLKKMYYLKVIFRVFLLFSFILFVSFVASYYTSKEE